MRRLIVSLLLALAVQRQASAEDNVVRAVFVDRPPKIDGRLDDAAWQKAALIDRFFQRDPMPGEPVSEKTEFLVSYDHENIYFAFRCYEPDPSLITAKEMARDVSLGEDDRVQVILDTYLDRRNGYWFQIGPRGSIGDALVADNGADFNKNWDGLWEGKARIHSQGWDGEIAIPFKTLSFRPGQTRWGMKLIRHIRRKLESSYWPVANRNTYNFQVSDEGILEGLEEITQGIGLDVSPYLPGGSFTTGVSRLNLNILFSPDITLYSFVQYNNLAKALGWQSRFRWILKPGRELLFVWNSRMVDPLERFELTEASARFKIRWNYRF